MEGQEHSVAIVLDLVYGARLPELAKELHVWLRESPENLDWVPRALGTDGALWNESGVTTFHSDSSAMPGEVLLGILPSVDLHHGEHSHDPPWTVLQVIGAQATEEVREALESYGVCHIKECASGFEARRPTPSA